jgi:CRISPR-associated protein Cmx8
MAGKKTKQTKAAPEVLELNYKLAELPSSQHRAGLAGLVLMVDWLKRQPNKKGICEITGLGARSAILKINQQGLEDLFNEVYAASMEEQSRDAPLKNKQKEIVPYLREEKRNVPDPKTGKAKEKTVYIYEGVIPRGAFLQGYDPSANGDWIKLWRNVIWTIFRGVPATRKPFKDRAEGKQTDDATNAWRELTQPPDYAVDLPSTYFIGAQANNAENVPFKDRARFQFLLHFWPYTAQIYVPAVITNEGKSEISKSFALAIPDVADLELFCEQLPVVLRNRGTGLAGYRPRDSVVDLAVESALDTLRRLQSRLTELEGQRSSNAADMVLGVDVVHLEKQGNNIRLWGSTRLDPEAGMIDEYARFRGSLWNPIFRRQRLLNLVNYKLSWYEGFDGLMSKLPYEQTIGNGYFRRDARESFSNEVKMMSEQTNVLGEEGEGNDLSLADSATAETLIYRVVSKYLRLKLDSKYKLVWKNVQGKPKEEGEYGEMKAKLAREAFLAIRSRTGQDFIDYFASTLCSVSQSMNEQRFLALTKALVENTNEVRTLTMLALAAQTPSPQKSSTQS